jgi:hypothetical protein
MITHMTDEYTQYQRLHTRVMQEVARQRLKAQRLPATPHHARLMGEFLRTRLEMQGRSAHDFAGALMLPTEMAELMLAGQVPDWLMSDEALTRIARVVDCDVNALRILLRRAAPPSQATADV